MRSVTELTTRDAANRVCGRFFWFVCWLYVIGVPAVYALRWLGWTWK